MFDTLKALQLMEQGFTTRRVAKEMGLELNAFFHRMNNKNGMSASKAESLIFKGVTAQQIYDEHYAPQEEPESLPPEEDDDRTDVQVTHELLRHILRELQVMNGRSAIFYPPPHMRKRARIQEEPPEESENEPKKKISQAKPWSAEEDDYLWTAFTVYPESYVEEFQRKYPKRIVQGIKMRLYQLQQKEKKNASGN